MHDDKFAEHLSTLPDLADQETEINWIRAHPLMLKAGAAPPKTTLALTVNDIQTAPSKSAVTSLQYWCNAPQQFFRMLVSGRRKIVKKKSKIDEEEERRNRTNFEQIVQPDVEEVNDDLTQLNRLANEAQRRQRRKDRKQERARKKKKKSKQG